MTKRTNLQEPLDSKNPDPATTPNAPAPAQDSGRQPFEHHLEGLPGWKVAALKAFTAWPVGYAVSQAEFDQALKDATGEVIK